MKKMKGCIVLIISILALCSIKTYALSPPSLTIENSKDVITSNNAVLNVALTNKQTKLITKFELKLYQYNELDERVLIATVDKIVNSKESKIQVAFNLYEDFAIELSPETKYSYYVSAFDESGGVSSGYSNGFRFTTPAVTHSATEDNTTTDGTDNDTTTDDTENDTTTDDAKISTNEVEIKKAKIKKIYAKKKSAKKLKLSIKKVKSATGYQIAVYKTKKNAKNSKNFLMRKSTKKLTVTIKSKKLKNKKKLYVRVRAYAVTNNGEKVYGKWSKVKKVAVKK